MWDLLFFCLPKAFKSCDFKSICTMTEKKHRVWVNILHDSVLPVNVFMEIFCNFKLQCHNDLLSPHQIRIVLVSNMLLLLFTPILLHNFFLSLVTRCTNTDKNKKLFSLLIFLCLRGATPPPGNSITVTLYNSNELNTEQKEKKIKKHLTNLKKKIQLIGSIIKRIHSCTAADYVAGTYWQT